MLSSNTTSTSGDESGCVIGDNPPKLSFAAEVGMFQTLAANRIWLISAGNVSPGIITAGPWLEIR